MFADSEEINTYRLYVCITMHMYLHVHLQYILVALFFLALFRWEVRLKEEFRSLLTFFQVYKLLTPLYLYLSNLRFFSPLHLAFSTSLSLSVSLHPYLSLSLSFSFLSLSLFVSLFLFISLSVCLSLCLSVCLSLCLSLSLSLSLSARLSLCLFLSLPVSVAVSLFVTLDVCFFFLRVGK